MFLRILGWLIIIVLMTVNFYIGINLNVFIDVKIITNKSVRVLIIILSGVVPNRVMHIYAIMRDLLKDRAVGHYFIYMQKVT